jgi:transposase
VTYRPTPSGSTHAGDQGRFGASAAAHELGLQLNQLYQWQAKAQQQCATAREQAMAEENTRLKRRLAEKSEELEIATKAAVYFAKSLK